MSDLYSAGDGCLLFENDLCLLMRFIATTKKTVNSPLFLEFWHIDYQANTQHTKPIHKGAHAGTMKGYSQHKLIGRKKTNSDIPWRGSFIL